MFSAKHIVLLRAWSRMRIGLFGAAPVSLLLLAGAVHATEFQVDCSQEHYRQFTSSEVFHGALKAGLNDQSELVLALNEDGFSDIDSRNGATDKVFRIALRQEAMAAEILRTLPREAPAESRITRHEAMGFTAMELRLLEGSASTWLFALDAHGCGAQLTGQLRVSDSGHVPVIGISVTKVSARRKTLSEAIDSFSSQPLMARPESGGEGTQAWCGHGGPGTMSCTVGLPFGLGCTAECFPGFYACCNSFGGCTCLPNDDDDGSVLPPIGGGGGTPPPPPPPGDDDDDDDDGDDDDDDQDPQSGMR